MLFEYIHGANSSVERDLQLVFERNGMVMLFSESFSVSSEAIHSFSCRSLLLGSTNKPNDNISM